MYAAPTTSLPLRFSARGRAQYIEGKTVKSPIRTNCSSVSRLLFFYLFLNSELDAEVSMNGVEFWQGGILAEVKFAAKSLANSSKPVSNFVSQE